MCMRPTAKTTKQQKDDKCKKQQMMAKPPPSAMKSASGVPVTSPSERAAGMQQCDGSFNSVRAETHPALSSKMPWVLQ